jgi:transcriptional regulator with XRE-family HTH domain
MSFNHSKLRGKMRELGFSQSTLADAIGINESTLSAKLNGKAYFSTLEIDKICQVLNIANAEIGAYFYAR